MSSIPAQMVNINCPACRRPYNAQVVSIVDVGQNPRLKTLLLQGRLNVTTCPNCGVTGMMNLPMAYHDPEKEFLFCLVPQELRLNENDRQRVIGELSRTTMNALPAEQRKGYLLRPRIFLTFQTMIEAVLEGDGITKEMLKAQEEKVQLMQRMAQSVGDTLTLSSMIAANAEQFDDEFFVLLSSSVQTAQQSGQTELAERLNVLLEKLIEQTPAGQKLARQQEQLEKALEGIDEHMTQEDLLKRVLSVEGEAADDILGVLISVARPLIDYRFFQLLTERLTQAEQADDVAFVERVKHLRARILELTQQLDAQVRIATEERTQLLIELVQSQDIKAAVRDHLDELDDAFMSVLAMNLQDSQQRDDIQMVQKLEQLRNAISEIMTENAPPEIQFIQRLLRAAYPDETRAMLQENPALVTPQLVQTIKLLATNMNSRQQPSLAAKLEQIAAQAELIAGA